MQISLVHVREDGHQQEVPVRGPRARIGRHTDCQIRVPVASVSRQHCELQLGEGTVELRDLGSSNGCFVNGERVDETELSAGDLLTLGSVVFVVRVDGEPEEIDAAAAAKKGKLPHPVKHAKSAAGSDEGVGAVRDQSGDSSVDFDFDLDLDDEEDDQPAL